MRWKKFVTAKNRKSYKNPPLSQHSTLKDAGILCWKKFSFTANLTLFCDKTSTGVALRQFWRFKRRFYKNARKKNFHRYQQNAVKKIQSYQQNAVKKFLSHLKSQTLQIFTANFITYLKFTWNFIAVSDRWRSGIRTWWHAGSQQGVSGSKQCTAVFL